MGAVNRKSKVSRAATASTAELRCRRKFLRFFPGGFTSEKYREWERDYKWEAHEKWVEQLPKAVFESLLQRGEYLEIAARAVRLESRTNLLFSFEKMALRDAVKPPHGAEAFATGLYEFIYGPGSQRQKFEHWRDVVEALPRKQTRVLTWPVVTVFAFIALPDEHIFLKPNVTREAAREYEFDFEYQSRPNWDTYASLLGFAARVQKDLSDLQPRDMIDIQSFIWVQGSDEY